MASEVRDLPLSSCAVDGCVKPRRKRGWCDNHYQRWRTTGDPLTPPKYTWREPGGPCIVCGSPDLAARDRRYCSDACRQRHRRARLGDGQLFPVVRCVDCGDPIPTDRPGDPNPRRGKGLRHRRRDVKWCDACFSQKHKHGISVKAIAYRDGTDCGICCQPIDLSIKAPDQRSVSIDHIVPRALGGTNDPANAQLAHRHCNQRKGTRLDWVSRRSGGEGGRRDGS